MNGKPPYYSADNGFACAAAGRGITESLQEHLNVIVRDESLATEMNHPLIQAEINDWVEDKERLEQQKLDRQDSIKELTDELAKKNVKLSELNIELEAPINGVADGEIEQLRDEIDKKIDKKKVKQAKLETALEAPTEVESKSEGHETAIQISSKRWWTSKKSWAEGIFSVFATAVVVGLVIYLVIFYASVGDRTFTKGIGTVEEKRQIIIPNAFAKALESTPATSENPEKPRNWFVLTFPCIFLTLAVLIYFCEKRKEWRWLVGLLLATALIDGIIAYKISEQMHIFNKGEPPDGPPYKFVENWVEVLSVFLLGFGVSLLLGLGLSRIMGMWQESKPISNESTLLEKQIRIEKNDRLVELAALTTNIQQLENRMGQLKQKKETKDKHTIEIYKHPIRTEIAELNTEKVNLQSQIDELNEQVKSFQKEIDLCETNIDALSKRQHKRVIDIKKMEAHVYEFVSGWCRYIAQRKNDLPADANKQIEDIQNLTQETLLPFKKTLDTI